MYLQLMPQIVDDDVLGVACSDEPTNSFLGAPGLAREIILHANQRVLRAGGSQASRPAGEAISVH